MTQTDFDPFGEEVDDPPLTERKQDILNEQLLRRQSEPGATWAQRETESLSKSETYTPYQHLSDVGVVYDFWSDLVEGQGEKWGDFQKAFREIVKARAIPDVTPKNAFIYSSGWLSRSLDFVTFKWRVARAAVKAEKIGNDLYVSWRVFIKPGVSLTRVLVWLAACGFFALILATGLDYRVMSNPYNYYWQNVWVERFIWLVIGSGILLAAWGLAKRGDLLAIWRERLDEFHHDDAQAAGHIVHKSVLAAADSIGIDSTTLAPKEALSPKQKRRI